MGVKSEYEEGEIESATKENLYVYFIFYNLGFTYRLEKCVSTFPQRDNSFP